MSEPPAPEGASATRRKDFRAGQRFEKMRGGWEGSPGIWDTMGWKLAELEPGYSVLVWEPDERFAFPTVDGGWIVHGGMVATILDTAMGQATWTLLDDHQVFLTAELRTEFYRPTLPGPVRATGWVVHRSNRLTFAAAELHDGAGRLLASGRATNMTIKARVTP